MQTTYCEIELDKAKRDAFVYAIKNHYWYQMYIDDLPIWGECYFVSSFKGLVACLCCESCSSIFCLIVSPLWLVYELFVCLLAY